MAQRFASRHPEAEERLRPIVVAARQCFARAGVEETRMEEVARSAGISRQYLYRLVMSRAELIELALLARLRELGAELAARARVDSRDVAEAIVDLVLDGIRLAREDAEFLYLAEAMPRTRLYTLLTSRASPLHAINTSVFGALFARALSEGRLRTDVTADAMVEWLQGVMTLLSARDDLEAEDQRKIVRDFVLPGLLRATSTV